MMDLWTAREIAGELVRQLEPGCERIGVAGSIRRGKAQVKDIELVASPRLGLNLFEEPDEEAPTKLDEALAEAMRLDQLRPAGKMGKRYKQFWVSFYVGAEAIKLDLFVVRPPAQWGVIYAIRTGPAGFSRWAVTRRSQGGGLPDHLTVQDGAVWDGERLVPMPEEDDFLKVIGMRGVAPMKRVAR
jgi:DNA polymerase/3'-5' exonuclease PolX